MRSVERVRGASWYGEGEEEEEEVGGIFAEACSTSKQLVQKFMLLL